MGCTRNAPGGLAGLDGGSGWESLARAPRVVSSGQQRALLHPAQREPQTRARPTRPCAVRAPRGELGVWHRNAPLALETESVPPRAPVSVTKLLGSPGGARPQNWTARPQRRAQGTQEESEDGSTGSPALGLARSVALTVFLADASIGLFPFRHPLHLSTMAAMLAQLRESGLLLRDGHAGRGETA